MTTIFCDRHGENPQVMDCPMCLKAKVEELEAWKDSALTVLNGIDLQAIGNALEISLGKEIGPMILPCILYLQARISDLENQKR